MQFDSELYKKNDSVFFSFTPDDITRFGSIAVFEKSLGIFRSSILDKKYKSLYWGVALCSICGPKYMGFAVLRVFRSPTPDIPNVYLDDAPFIPHFKREDFSEDDYGHWLHYHWFSFGFFPMVMM